jgi:hypothetical protein
MQVYLTDIDEVILVGGLQHVCQNYKKSSKIHLEKPSKGVNLMKRCCN